MEYATAKFENTDMKSYKREESNILKWYDFLFIEIH